MKKFAILTCFCCFIITSSAQDNSLKFEGTWIDIKAAPNSTGSAKLVIKKNGPNFIVRAWNISEASGEELPGIYYKDGDYISVGYGATITYKVSTGTLLCWGEEFKKVDVQKKINEDVSLSNWTPSEREAFLSECLPAANKAFGNSNGKIYCDCVLSKVEAQYPNYSESGKLLARDINTQEWKNKLNECLKKIGRARTN